MCEDPSIACIQPSVKMTLLNIYTLCHAFLPKVCICTMMIMRMMMVCVCACVCACPYCKPIGKSNRFVERTCSVTKKTIFYNCFNPRIFFSKFPMKHPHK